MLTNKKIISDDNEGAVICECGRQLLGRDINGVIVGRFRVLLVRNGYSEALCKCKRLVRLPLYLSAVKT